MINIIQMANWIPEQGGVKGLGVKVILTINITLLQPETGIAWHVRQRDCNNVIGILNVWMIVANAQTSYDTGWSCWFGLEKH